MAAGIELDDDPQWARRAGDRRGEPLGGGDRIDADRQVDLVVEGAQTAGLRPDRPDRVGDEQVGEAGGREDLGLAKRADGQAAGPAFQLHPGEGDALVGLDVRPQSDAARVEGRLEPARVRLDDIEVDDEARRVEPIGESRRGHGSVRGNWRGAHRPALGRATIGVVSVPSRSIRRVTVSPASRYRPSVPSRLSRSDPLPTVPEPMRSPGRSRTSAAARASI